MHETPDSRSPAGRTTGTLLLATWLALGFGLAEVAALLLQRALLGKMVFVGRDIVWMAPLAVWLLFVAAAALLRAVPSTGDAETVLVLAALGFLGIGLMFSALHPVGAALLAAGLGSQTARLYRRFPAAASRWLRRTIVPLMVGFGVLAVGLPAIWQLRESRALGGLNAAPAAAPNILLIVLDTVRARSLSVHGYERRTTPVLEELAADGTRFARAHSTAPWTLPAHASMFTGRWPWETSADWRRPLDGTHPTLAEELRRHGYATAGFVANTGYASRETGLHRGFIHYEDYPTTPAAILVSSSIGRRLSRWRRLRDLIGTDELVARKDAAVIRTAFLDWLDGDRPDRPFFAFLNFYDAHGPYMPPAPFAARFARDEPRGGISPLHRFNDDPTPEGLSPEQVRKEREAYEGAIAYLDSELGALLRELGRRGLRQSTIIVVTSDHGEEFGEHGFFDHANSMFVSGLHVPLLIAHPPTVPADVVVGQPVSLRDLPATLLDLALGRDAVSLPGSPLTRFWRDSSSPDPSPVLSHVSRVPRAPEWLPVARGDLYSLVARHLRYVRGPAAEDEMLFDLASDPMEEQDLSAVPAMKARLTRLRDRLDDLVPRPSTGSGEY